MLKIQSIAQGIRAMGVVMALCLMVPSAFAELSCPNGFMQLDTETGPGWGDGPTWCVRTGQANGGESRFIMNQTNIDYFNRNVAPCEAKDGINGCWSWWEGDWTTSGGGDSSERAGGPVGRRTPTSARPGEGEGGAPAGAAPAPGGGGQQTAACWQQGSTPVSGQPMCGSDGTPACTMPGEAAQQGKPVCTADGRPGSQQPGQRAGGTGDVPDGFPQRAEVDHDREYCESSQTAARICCTDPIQCVSGVSGPTAGTITAVGSIALGALAATSMAGAQGGDPNGIAKNCQLMKTLGMGGAAANTALGAKCFADKGTCESRCEEVRNKYRRVLADCDNLETVWRQNNGQGQRCPTTWTSDYRSVIATATGRRDACTGYNANIAAMGNQATQSALASKFAEQCENAATAQSTGFPDIDQQPVFNGDCNDPVNASNPICIKCRGSAAQYDPLCRGLNGGRDVSGVGTGGSGFSQADYGTRKVDGSDLNVPTVDGQKQGPVFGDPASQRAQANAIPQNGGGFSGGSGGGGMPFGGGQGGGGGGGEPGYDTDILKGVGGGGGYSVSSVPVDSRGGYAGPSGGRLGNGEANPFDKFNLKKYLPGGERDPRARGLAGLQTGKTEIGKPHEDIFQRVTDRVKVLCRMKRLYDCK